MTEIYYYSAVNNAFYALSLKGEYIASDSWPADAVEVSEKWYSHLMDGQSKGKVIIANEYCQPILANPPAPTPEELVSEAESKKQRLLAEATAVIAPLQDAVDFGDATDEEATKLLAWKKYRIQINRVDASNPEWPEIVQ